MNLHAMLLERQAAGRPVTVGLIGAGKFGTMFASQVRSTDGMHLLAVADLDVSRARRQLRTAGWKDEAMSAPSLENARARRTTHVTEDAQALIARRWHGPAPSSILHLGSLAQTSMKLDRTWRKMRLVSVEIHFCVRIRTRTGK